MNGLSNTLEFIQENWSNILLIITAIVTVIYRVISFNKLSKQQKVEAILTIVKSELLKFMSEAEIDWKEYEKSGLLKKSDVITKIYDKFPLLKEYLDQDTLIQTISNMIDSGMTEMNKIVNGVEPDKLAETIVTEDK